MNLHPLIAGFESVAESPGNIQRLRKLVINLAISGMLISDDDGTLPVKEILSRIEKDKTRRSKSEKHRRQAILTPVVEDDLPIGCADPARFVRLEDIASLKKGLTSIQSALPGEFPLVTTAERKSPCDHFDFDGRAAIIPLVSSTGHGSATLNRLHYQEGKFALGTILCAVFPLSEEIFSARFIFEYLSAFKEELLVSRMTGTANVTLTLGRIGAVPIPIVAPNVQWRIEHLMTLCDQLEAAQRERESRRDRLTAATYHHLNNSADTEPLREHVQFFIGHLPRLTARPDQINQLRQTILDMAVRGRLVLQDPSDEPASELLKRIQAEKPALASLHDPERQNSKSGMLKGDTPFGLPSNWQWTSLKRLIVFGPQNGISPKPSSRPDAPRAITLTATTKGIFDSNYFKRVDATIPPGSEFWLRSGDLLFQRGNTREYVGMAAYYTGEPGVFLYPDLMIKVRLSENVSLRYVHLCAVAPHARSYFSSHASGAQATMPKINQDILSNLPIPLPPLAEQNRIVGKVDELMALCHQLEAQLTSARTDTSRLLDAILHNALNGRLETINPSLIDLHSAQMAIS